ncbi:MAG: hypothetical protein ACOVRG_09180, partial [Saprospiraceae bacterium]
MKTNFNAILHIQHAIKKVSLWVPYLFIVFGLILTNLPSLRGQNNPCGCTDLNVTLNDNCQRTLFLKNIFPNAGNTAGTCDTTGMVLKIADLN